MTKYKVEEGRIVRVGIDEQTLMPRGSNVKYFEADIKKSKHKGTKMEGTTKDLLNKWYDLLDSIDSIKFYDGLEKRDGTIMTIKDKRGERVYVISLRKSGNDWIVRGDGEYNRKKIEGDLNKYYGSDPFKKKFEKAIKDEIKYVERRGKL